MSSIECQHCDSNKDICRVYYNHPSNSEDLCRNCYYIWIKEPPLCDYCDEFLEETYIIEDGEEVIGYICEECFEELSYEN